MNELVGHVSQVLNKHIPMTHFPYWLGMLGGYCFDVLAWMLRKKLTVSSVRVKNFVQQPNSMHRRLDYPVLKPPIL